ncbi:hypothetical protein STIAU_6876 [Stigmatella aurantiaca DW4/3-1]|uniref:Uncharacterized protein n=1 Tax=Stigmatella aurantiaca (strain DW4/3-1) TaxID=378806 RepID=Q09AX2_STIAD|nr:hypothetical protein STIAU_6876 [Stigmatella aurantiaca DW4/3-1]
MQLEVVLRERPHVAPPAQQGLHLVLRLVHQVRIMRLDVEIQGARLPIELLEGPQGHDDEVVHAHHAQEAAAPLQHADDGEGPSLHANLMADRILARQQRVRHVQAHHRHVAPIHGLGLPEEPSGRHRDAAGLQVLGRGPEDAHRWTRLLGGRHDLLASLVVGGRHRLHRRARLLDGAGILQGEARALGVHLPVEAAKAHGPLRRHEGIGAELGQILVHLDAQPLDEGHHRDDRGHANDDPQQRQQRAQRVPQERAKGQTQVIEKGSHGVGLLVAQRFHGIEVGRPGRGPDAKQQAHHRREAHPRHHGDQLNIRRQGGDEGDHLRRAQTHHGAQCAPHGGDGRGLHQELHHDGALAGPQCPADANLPCPLSHGHQHDVHDADAPHQQGDETHAHRHAVERSGELLIGVGEHLGAVDGEIVWGFRRGVPDAPQNAHELILGAIHVLGAPHREGHAERALLAKQGVERLEGHHHGQILVVVQHHALARQRAHHLEGTPVNPDRLSHGADPRKEPRGHVRPEDGHGAGRLVVRLRQETAQDHFETGDGQVLVRHPVDVHGGQLLLAVGHIRRAPHHRRDRGEVRGLGADLFQLREGEVLAVAVQPPVPSHHPGELGDEEVVGADGGQLSIEGRVEPLDDADDGQQGGHADADADRREHRAHPVGLQRVERDAPSLQHVHSEAHNPPAPCAEGITRFVSATSRPGPSATTSPSLRRTARGQRAASLGSWVTSTRVCPARWSSSKSRTISSPVAESRFPVGSSARSMEGSATSARAMATRWRWPPDSSLGRWCMRWPSCTFSRAAFARSRRSRAATPRYTSGSSTLESAVSRGSSWKVWKMKPISLFRMSASSSSFIRATSLPLRM